MSQLPFQPLPQEQQQRFLEQMFYLMGKQVQSYHKHRRLGESSSVPTELAQELMASVEYTLSLVGGFHPTRSLEETLRLGQKLLKEKHTKATTLLTLITATAPTWQTRCRWDALDYLQQYLQRYDYRHLAHQGPDDLFYPILVAPPEGIQGIDLCLFYLNILWAENQIMAAIPSEEQEELWNRLPASALNQCEHLLINALGKTLLHSPLSPLVFNHREHAKLLFALAEATAGSLQEQAEALCRQLKLRTEPARVYACAITAQFSLWSGRNAANCSIPEVFL